MKKPIAIVVGLGVNALWLAGCKDGSEPEAVLPLFGTRWTLAQVDDVAVAASSNSEEYNTFIKFNGADNTTTGAAACNATFGTFSLKTGTQQLTISSQGTTYKYCGQTPITDRYESIIPTTARYEIQGRVLRLYDATTVKPRLVFQATQ